LEFEGTREQHYTFAHRLLPQAIFSDPIAFLDVISGPSGAEALREAWTQAGPAFGMPPDGLAAETRVVGEQVLVVITLPPPACTTEAYFVAAVLRAREAQDDGQEVEARVFTLEYSDPSDGVPDAERAHGDRAVALLCEWTATGEHRNHGQAVEPTVDRFVAAVMGCLAAA
jgi:hypothetical protein